MSMNDTPASERVHIAFFGCRNAGKSSLLNAVTGQRLSVVSEIPGTTTDPVYKTMELLPAGPVVLIDTPGLDDEGALGDLRVASARRVLDQTDVAVAVIDGTLGKRPADDALLRQLAEKNIPCLTVFTKADRIPPEKREPDALYVSSESREGLTLLKERMARLADTAEQKRPIAGDLIHRGEPVVLVVPIDRAAPKGRLILPQQQVIRDLLEHGAIPVVARDTELQTVLDRLQGQIALVITDSQVFGRVAAAVPDSIPLTSFSILFSRYKGELARQLAGIRAVDDLRDGDTVLISEGCTHHRQCGDIGSEKIPAALAKYTGKTLNIQLSGGKEFPEELSPYRLIIHCGGCMLSRKEMQSRLAAAEAQHIPITNYGMVLALCNGILERSLRPLGGAYAL